MQQYDLGRWFRNRYDNFLQGSNLLKDVYVFSTDKERTLMSAESTLAGLFPPTAEEIWNPDLKWQPIPIHTVPLTLDCVLAMKKYCSKYNYEYLKFSQSSWLLKVQEENEKLFSYLTENVGYKVKGLVDIQNLYNTLFIEDKKNYILPNWAKLVFPSPLKALAGLSFATPTFTTELARLKVGPFIDRIAMQFEDRTSTKFLIHSAHDTTIAHILNSLHLFEYHCPPYSAALIFELHKFNDDYFVNILYKNGSVPHELVLKPCEFNCPLDKFLDIIQPIRMTVDEWQSECDHFSIETESVVTVFESNVFITCVIISMLVVSGLVSVVIYIKVNNSRRNQYIALPNDDAERLIPFA